MLLNQIAPDDAGVDLSPLQVTETHTYCIHVLVHVHIHIHVLVHYL